MQEAILIYLQSISTPSLDILVEGLTILGEETVFIAVTAFLYWCVSRKKAFILSCALLFSVCLNGIIKIIFRAPRPFQVLDFIEGKRVHTATGYSFPSGHTQSASTFYMSGACLLKKTSFWVAASVISILVAFSRVYLGVHWPVDVMASLILGTSVALVICRVLDHIWEREAKRNLFILSLIIPVSLSLVLMALLDRTLFHGQVKIDDYFKGAGVFLGVMGGFILEERYLGFSASLGSLTQKIIRFLLGLMVLAVVLYGLKIILPYNYRFHALRYAVLGFTMTFLYPAMGVKAGLFTTKP